ncbi:hypothetical protein GBAR_LOCUS14114 [Geodia barretti]|uniref:Uncharacterized protein n=1 Tax=Geodia barretti TaxID=519541 RepID=A0AA35S6C5_GEOBA|nr:hypothetical protein GBAR_LOCUS14114 [Geodia barretti]
MPSDVQRNRISKIGVKASSGGPEGCVEVEVDLELCVAWVGGREVDGSVTISQVRVSRVMINLWRVAVPNYQRPGLVMWVTCMSNRLCFDVNRGSSLRPSSHGLLGQFWNIPISVGDLDSDSSPDIELYQPGHPSYRHFPALFYHLVWDLSDDGCYYVGNSQGGPEGSRDPINSVIEGSYSQYIVDGLFDTEFEYERFDENAC